MNITIEQAAAIAMCAVKVGPAVAGRFGAGSTGGYLYISNGDGQPLLQVRIAHPNVAKAKKYAHLSFEKAERLHRHSSHDLSWQSADPKKEQYQGRFVL